MIKQTCNLYEANNTVYTIYVYSIIYQQFFHLDDVQ